jgi:nitrite reductase/ring-hydroxylating ferredoxin subunit
MTEPPAASPALLQIGRRPDDTGPGGTGPAPAGLGGGEGAWVTLPGIGPPSSRPVSASAGGVPVLVCAVRGTLYAYRDACPGCGASMAGGHLDREVLTCPCGTRYDVRAAGRQLGDGPGSDLHLDPLPLLTDSAGVRVAVPVAVAP